MSFHYELSCKGFSAEEAHYLVTLQNDLCCSIGLTFTLSLNPLKCSGIGWLHLKSFNVIQV